MATAVKRRSRYTNYSRVPYDAYDGSAARQLQREEVLRPRPMVRPRERAVVRPRVRVREAGLVSPFAVVGFLAVGVFAVLLLFSYVQLTTISQQVVELRSEMTALQSEEAKLRTAYDHDSQWCHGSAAERAGGVCGPVRAGHRDLFQPGRGGRWTGRHV